MQEWSYMARGHNIVNYCSEAHLKEGSFQPQDLSWAARLRLGRGLRHTIARVRGVLGAAPPHGSTVASCG